LYYNDDKRVRLISATSSVVFHLLLLILLSLFVVWEPKQPELIELDWGGSSGAPNQSITETETNPKQQTEAAQSGGAATKTKVDLPATKSPSNEVIPSTKKAKPKSSVGTRQDRALAEGTSRTKHRRAKEGAAGGAGTSTGYSIEWAGTGSRRLLSGRIPRYPEGTDKQLPVTLQFSVLPDGSVSSVIPLMKSDELLEREAISALKTWRFDPLPPQFEQKTQAGKITFIFKLE
jgi:protein TonB